MTGGGPDQPVARDPAGRARDRAAFAAHAEDVVELDHADGRRRLTLGALLAANLDDDGEVEAAARAVIRGEPFTGGGGAEPAWTLRPIMRGA